MPVIICICIHFNIYQGIMMASSNRNIARITGPLWGKSTGHRWIPLTKASDAELYVFFDLRLNKWSNKRSRRWRFETQLRTLWRHCYDSAGRLHSSSIFSNSAASVLFIQMPQHLFPKPMNVQNRVTSEFPISKIHFPTYPIFDSWNYFCWYRKSFWI